MSTEPTPRQDKRGVLKSFVRGVYDLQKLRIATGLRIVANFKAKLGQRPSEAEEELDDDAREIIEDLRARYERITDGVATMPRMKDFKGDELISEYSELSLLSLYFSMEAREVQAFGNLKSVLTEFPVWNEYLSKVKGIGPAMGAVIVSYFNIHKAKYPSSMWMYAGLDVAADGAGRSRRSEHLVEREYIDKDGETKTKKSITFTPFLKTKLIGVLGSSFLRANSPYAQVYRDYKTRLENHAKHGIQNDKTRDERGRLVASKAHRHAMATRYMVKMFLIDLHREWSAIEGIPPTLPYHVAKLGYEAHAPIPVS